MMVSLQEEPSMDNNKTQHGVVPRRTSGRLTVSLSLSLPTKKSSPFPLSHLCRRALVLVGNSRRERRLVPDLLVEARTTTPQVTQASLGMTASPTLSCVTMDTQALKLYATLISLSVG